MFWFVNSDTAHVNNIAIEEAKWKRDMFWLKERDDAKAKKIIEEK